ncbi:protein of unknown function [Methylocella tundrae]|uniref:Uncharacterized protein n=1 Tax=Methylocella tundrae TaxID=227605 RepID=A0A4U8Z2U2_METTU|nr:protein of unknown function [Methylocella tundrae]
MDWLPPARYPPHPFTSPINAVAAPVLCPLRATFSFDFCYESKSWMTPIGLSISVRPKTR